ncbi:hypothetical protein [Microterricola pindariensis]|uniref:Gram-positive cocci surface proteins LPxTG domain-containing protein n=1 Tax=Microterricola pindariensis TaxID=478010 RepID=A0ABX5AUT5_9MICO|nr:hypothetical protein [Microterricola pindariensis]PPL16139.1 hypothetical protein GY24_13200 [Microterricola pindariensis]
MQKPRSRRAFCALAAGAFVVASALTLTAPVPALAASAAPGGVEPAVGDVLGVVDLSGVGPAGASPQGPDPRCALVDVQLSGEPVVASTLTATAVGGLFDGARVRFEWIVEPAAPGAGEPGATPTASPSPTPSPAPSSIPSPTPTPAPTSTPAPPRGEYIVRGADLGQTIRVLAITRGSDDAAPALGCLSAPSAVVRAGGAPDQGGVTPPLVPPLVPLPEPPVAALADDGTADWAGQQEADVQEPEDQLVTEAPAAAPGPIVNINVSDDVLLIGGLGALAVMAGLLVFGRNEN